MRCEESMGHGAWGNLGSRIAEFRYETWDVDTHSLVELSGYLTSYIQ
jgi:hypothetical protein